MSDRTGTINRYLALQRTVGRNALSAFYPQDVEYYLCAFELVSSSGTEGYFVFPIQPNSIQKSEPTRTNIKKSMSGITALRNSSFIPWEISIKGNFGKRFKIMNQLDGVGFGATITKDTGIQFATPVFSASIKTGYGATKLLQKILQDSQKLDGTGKPKRLYFYNMALGESYLVIVPPSGFTLTQTVDQNTIWQYAVNMTVLAPLYAVTGVDVDTANRNIISKGIIQRGVNTVVNDVKVLLTT